MQFIMMLKCGKRCLKALECIFGTPVWDDDKTEEEMEYEFLFSPFGVIMFTFAVVMIPSLCQIYWYTGKYNYIQPFVKVMTERSINTYFDSVWQEIQINISFVCQSVLSHIAVWPC